MNPLQQALNGGKIANAVNPVQNLIGTLKAAKNPAMMLNQMAGQNPIVKQAMDIVQQYNGDQMAAFTATAKQYGVDPNQILAMLK